MSDQARAQALSQLQRIAQLYDFTNHPAEETALAEVPVTMPHALGALGFDEALWTGLGIVGLWAALDAFADRVPLNTRCSTCHSRSCVAARFAPFAGAEQASLNELEDLRHLYAHNFAGQADAIYLSRRRHILLRGTRGQLSCGAPFDNGHVSLEVSYLRSYAEAAARVIQRV
jgi:hypothetical protein